MKIKPFKLNNAWVSECKLPVIEPYLTLRDEAALLPQRGKYYTINGYQLVHPYYKEVIFKVKDKRYVTAMELLKSSFAGTLNARHLELDVPQERDSCYWDQLQNRNLIWLKALRKVGGLCDHLRAQYEALNSKKAVELTLVGKEMDEFALNPKDQIFSINCVHELPVPVNSLNGVQIKIVYEDAKIVVVDKPYGVPVHPTGNNYRFNSVLSLLKKQLDLKGDLWPCHRLDKETTGILIFAKSSNICGQVSQLIANKSVFTKTYLANVYGSFPSQLKNVDKIISLDLTKEYKNGGVMATPVEATSIFHLVKYNAESNVSTVKIGLQTGRRHQIRQHLRNMGFHIVNDPLYGLNAPLSMPMHHLPDETEFNSLRNKYLDLHQQKMNRGLPINVCHDCAHVTYIPKSNNSNQMQLHALEYKLKNGSLSFKTDLPSWC